MSGTSCEQQGKQIKSNNMNSSLIKLVIHGTYTNFFNDFSFGPPSDLILNDDVAYILLYIYSY